MDEAERGEAELVAAARRGDPAAARAIYDLHAPRVWAVVRRLAGDEARAEDWAQDAWVRAFHALGSFRGDARLATWLHRIAVTAALDGRRRLAARPEDPGLDGAAADAAIDGGPTVVDRLTLERALDRLPEGMRRVLVLHDVEGYSHDEIAAALGVAAGTSRSQLFKARAKLREWMTDAGAVPAGERRERWSI